ncbi:MAG: lytic transglycosylase [Gammaproteobacteria bacterium CG11_big_fil_rev_8_21_14_0_20_46_22]|nr:MAG: lytic transglycosylase [Gammaproteobacteria bacterium CG12_big_fil_rev_8_21_14_0_65_46_12]PIR12010.1 MAG: lytic transglycosylase [Gammaproteobacteria bacterium CG11_big_fil_rev_8_21_14_0_20_46_22]
MLKAFLLRKPEHVLPNHPHRFSSVFVAQRLILMQNSPFVAISDRLMTWTKWLSTAILTFALCLMLGGCAAGYSDSYTSGFGTPTHLKQYKDADNLWTVLGDSFDLPDESSSNAAVAWQIKWFMKNPKYVQKMAESAAPYLYYIFQQVKKRHLPAELALLPMVESAYDPYATNYGSGAAGLWQMMPGTASGFGLRLDWWYDGRRDVVASTNAALNYFVYLGKFFNGDWLLAIAAYDSGEGTVEDAIKRNARAGKPTEFWYLSLPYETETYVPKLLALATIISHPDEYPIQLPVVKNAPYLAKVNIGTQIDLSRAASMAGLSLDQLSELNPGYNRWATDPSGPHVLFLPITHVDRFKRELAKLPVKDRVSWNRALVRHGDTLDSFAKRYHTSVTLIRQVNHLHNNSIYPGQALFIPTGSDRLSKLVLHNEHLFNESHTRVRVMNITRHTVKKGETLWTIAKHYHVSVRQIKFWNSLRSDYVAPGTSLIIWPPHNKKHPTYWAPTYHHYRVKSGDTVWDIAVKYHINPDVLVKLNHIQHNFIKPGMDIKVPMQHEYIAFSAHIDAHHSDSKPHKKVTSSTRKLTIYHVQSGDYLDKIAKKFGMNSKTLMLLNGLTRKSVLHKGQALRVYAAH